MFINTLMQIYNGKEKVGQKEMQNIQFEDKSRTRKFNLGARAYMEIKGSPDPYWNKWRGTLRMRPHPAKLPTCEWRQEFSVPKEKQINTVASVIQGGQGFIHLKLVIKLGNVLSVAGFRVVKDILMKEL